MISEKMKDIAEAMIQGEYYRVVKEHGRFNSLHEGYAVLKEENDNGKQGIY